MAKRVGLISISLVAGTAQFNTDMGNAKAKIVQIGGAAQDAGKHMVNAMQASSAAIRVMEGGLTNNLRAVERFVSSTLGLGKALQSIFPVVGALAFGGLIVSIGEKVYAFYKKVEEGPVRVANAFRELLAPLKLTNDELRVTNDRLASDIAKLEGKRQNNLQIALDEARVTADHLAESLEKDLTNLNKLLKEENISAFKGFFTNQASTSDLKKYLGGETGTGGFFEDVAQINDKGRAKIDAAAERKDKAGQDAAILEMNTALEKKYAEAIKVVSKALVEARLNQIRRDDILKAQADAPALSLSGLPGQPVASKLATEMAPPDQSVEIEMARGALRVLREGPQLVDLTAKEGALKGRKADDEATNAGQKLEKPLADKLAQLAEQLAASQERLDGAGKTEEMKDLAAASIEAGKALLEVNKRLNALHEKEIDPNSATAMGILATETQIAQNNAESKWRDELAATESKMAERTASYRDLAAAIGLSYEATKKANAELAVNALAKQYLQDPAWMANPEHATQIAGVSAAANDEFDAKHSEQVAVTLDKLKDQIELEQRLVKVQGEGAEAIRLVTLAAKIDKIQTDNDAASAEKLTRAELELYGAQQLVASGKNIAEINREISDTERLTAARIEGAETERRMALELKYAQMLKDGGPTAQASVDAQRLLDEIKHQDALTDSVLKTANADRDRLQAIDAEAKAAALLLGTEADQLGVMLKLRDLENERLKIISRQLLAEGTARDGVMAFFLEMEESAKNTGQIIYDALNQAFDKTASNLTQLITGGKTKWGQMFKDIGREMLDATIKQQLQHGLGALGKKLGIGRAGTVTRKGQTPGTGIYVIPVNQAGAPGGGQTGGVASGTAAASDSTSSTDGGTDSTEGHVAIASALAYLVGSWSNSRRSDNSETPSPGDPGLDQSRLPGGLINRTGAAIDGVPSVADTQDGQSEQTAYWTQQSGSAQTGTSPLSKLSGMFGGAKAGGGLLSTLGGLFGGGAGAAAAGGCAGDAVEAVSSSIEYMKDGGNMSADKAYIAGDDGPEIIHGINATVMNHAASKKLVAGNGGDHNYTIDARGTDPALTEQRVRAAIISAHNSAVGTAVAVTADRLKRTPAKK